MVLPVRLDTRLAVVLAVAVMTLSTTSAAAQDPEAEGATFADVNGLMWAVGATELAFGAGIVSLVGADCHGSRCAAGSIGMVLGALSIGVGVGTAAGEGGLGPEAPFLLHNFLSSAIVGFLPTMVYLDEGSSDAVAFAGGLSVGMITGLAMSVYPFLRRHTLLYDPDATAGAHLLAWGPLAAGLLTTISMAAVDAEDEHVIFVSLAMLVVYGLAIGVVESSVDGNATTVGPPTLGPLTQTADAPVAASIGFSF
jgi:hypothetical protein